MVIESVGDFIIFYTMFLLHYMCVVDIPVIQPFFAPFILLPNLLPFVLVRFFVVNSSIAAVILDTSPF